MKFDVDVTVTAEMTFTLQVEAEDGQAAVDKAVDLCNERPSRIDDIAAMMPEGVSFESTRCYAWTNDPGDDGSGYESEEDYN